MWVNVVGSKRDLRETSSREELEERRTLKLYGMSIRFR